MCSQLDSLFSSNKDIKFIKQFVNQKKTKGPSKIDKLLENIFAYSDIRGDTKFEIMIAITYVDKFFKMQNYFKQII